MRSAAVIAGLAGALVACAPPPPPPPPPVPVGPPTDTVRIPLTDLGSGTYFGHTGGLYLNGANQLPSDHDSAARARRNAIRPLDVNGDESPFGKYVMIAIGAANATREWCSQSSAPPCGAWTFMGRAAADPTVNRASLVIVNGAADGQEASSWMSAASPNYDRIKIARLAPLGLSENQVQAAWVNLADSAPTVSLPSDSADAYLFLSNLAQVARTLKVRYPNLQMLFISGSVYGGYATSATAEPYAYEQGFSIKWLVESQVNEMRGLPANSRAGSLNYLKKTAPLMMWGPYLWANGTTARSDGVMWDRADFEEDGVHPSQSGESKAARTLLDFFKNSPYSKCWFLANQYCL